MVQKKASYTVVFISVFCRFNADDRRKCIKKYAFSYENGLVFTSENITKTLLWSKIFCLVFVETKGFAFKLVHWITSLILYGKWTHSAGVREVNNFNCFDDALLLNLTRIITYQVCSSKKQHQVSINCHKSPNRSCHVMPFPGYLIGVTLPTDTTSSTLKIVLTC